MLAEVTEVAGWSLGDGGVVGEGLRWILSFDLDIERRRGRNSLGIL